jgi:hypothetical protein
MHPPPDAVRRAWSLQRLVRAMSNEDLRAELELLRKENAVFRKEFASRIRLKVSEKGAVSVYGIRRFPVTLYKEQWLKLLDRSSDIRAFIAANKAQLKSKDRWLIIFAGLGVEARDRIYLGPTARATELCREALAGRRCGEDTDDKWSRLHQLG